MKEVADDAMLLPITDPSQVRLSPHDLACKRVTFAKDRASLFYHFGDSGFHLMFANFAILMREFEENF